MIPTYDYDLHRNITEIRFFHAGEQLNLGYTFEYDDKLNPTYSLDDARLQKELQFFHPIML